MAINNLDRFDGYVATAESGLILENRSLPKLVKEAQAFFNCDFEVYMKLKDGKEHSYKFICSYVRNKNLI